MCFFLSEVYLGFQEDINQKEFRNALEHSYETKTVLDVEKYVQKIPNSKLAIIKNSHHAVVVEKAGEFNRVLESFLEDEKIEAMKAQFAPPPYDSLNDNDKIFLNYLKKSERKIEGLLN